MPEKESTKPKVEVKLEVSKAEKDAKQKHIEALKKG